MPKKSNAPDGAARPSIPWRIRVRKDEEFRPLSVSMEGTFLGGCLSAAGWRRIPSGERTTRFTRCTTGSRWRTGGKWQSSESIRRGVGTRLIPTPAGSVKQSGDHLPGWWLNGDPSSV